MTIRLATKDDLPEILLLCEEFHNSSPYSSVSQSTEMTVQTISSFLDGPLTDKVILLSTGIYGQLNGILAGAITSLPFSTAKVAYEGMWYVRPEARGRDALELFNAFEDWSIRVKADIVVMNLLEGDYEKSLTKLYTRKGYSKSEISFFKKLNWS